MGRRESIAVLASSIYASLTLAAAPHGGCAEPERFSPKTTVPFSNPSQGYSLQRPSDWEQVEKAGADVLFRDPSQRYATLGVTVLPVMIQSLEKFGSLDSVGDKLLNAERAKESTLNAIMVDKAQRLTEPDDVLLYDFVYELNSTRGRKLVASTVTIVNSKLYIVNGTLPCSKESCEGASGKADLLKRVTQSLKVTT